MNNAAMTALRNIAENAAAPRYRIQCVRVSGGPKRFVLQTSSAQMWQTVAGPFGSYDAASEAAAVLRTR